MIIRDFQANDQAVFLSMAKTFYAPPYVLHSVDSDNFKTTFKLIIDGSPFVRGLILTHEEAVVGYALLSFTYSNEVGGLVVFIEELYFMEAYRGQGLGHEFFSFIAEQYPQARRFRLEVRKDNPAAYQLYLKLGYEESGYIQLVKDQKTV